MDGLMNSSEHSYCQDETHDCIFPIIKHAFLLYHQSQYCKKILRKSKLFDYHRLPVENSIVIGYGNDVNLSLDKDNYVGGLTELVHNWGMQMIDMPKDGNCLFHTIAFQLNQLFNSDHISGPKLMKHLGLGGNENQITIIQLLRKLLVSEWTGVNWETYQPCLTDGDMDLALSFLKDGFYHIELGNAMLVGMSNVLGYL